MKRPGREYAGLKICQIDFFFPKSFLKVPQIIIFLKYVAKCSVVFYGKKSNFGKTICSVFIELYEKNPN